MALRGTHRLVELAREAPTGLVILSGILAIVGAGLVVGGVYQFASQGLSRWLPALAAAVTGPIVLYTAFHLLRRAPWAHRALLLALGLLLLSSIARIVATPARPLVPLVEIAVELACLYYLTRPGVAAAAR